MISLTVLPALLNKAKQWVHDTLIAMVDGLKCLLLCEHIHCSHILLC